MSKESLDLSVSETKRPISPGGEKWLGESIPLLDHGFVYLVDYMGTDESIEQAARVSYGKGTRTTSQTEGLIRYLYRNRHTTPFEMVELKFHAKMPILVARQWVRHRTANINEYSARYSVLDNEFYTPELGVLGTQSKDNKQGRGESLDQQTAERIRQILIEDAARNYENYENLLELGLARELARNNLPVSVYTQWYWKIDLHNLFHFLSLRMDPHAQYEIRQYAGAMAEIVKDIVPIAYKAFEDYQLNATYLSAPEQKLFAELLGKTGILFTEEEILVAADTIGLVNKRELGETISKLKKLGILK